MTRLLVAAFFVLLLMESGHAGEREMMAALRAGDIEAMRAELAAGADPNGALGSPPPMAPWLPVYLAAEAGRADALALLVEFGADIDLRDRNGDRPLDWASRYGEMEVVRLLVDAGATPNPREAEPDVDVPLVEALGGGHVEVAHFLLDHGADPNRASTYGGAPLYRAAGLRDTAPAARLLTMGAAVAPRDRLNRETPLHRAAVWSTPEMVRLLVRAGAPLDARDWDGETPLFQAARLGRHEIVAILVEAGSSLDIPDEEGRSPLVAVLTNRPKPAYELGIDDPFISTRDLILTRLPGLPDRDFDATAHLLASATQDLDMALAEAVWGGWEEAARILVARGALGQARTADGRAALGGVFHYPGLDMFELLVKANSNQSIEGAAAIVAAAAAGRMDIARALFAERWPVDTRGSMGRTALLAAAVEGRIGTVVELAALGADPAVHDSAGHGMVELMTARLSSLICLAEAREASRAFLPTDFIRGEVERLDAAYREILDHFGMPEARTTLIPAEISGCLGY